MNIELSVKELDLLHTILTKEEAEVKVEIHHCRNYEYREFLKGREEQIISILKQLSEATAMATKR